MKRIMIPFFALLIISIALISWKSQKFEGAIHASGDDCHFYINDGGELTVGSYKYVETPSGNATLTCKAKGVPNNTGKAIVLRPEDFVNQACIIDGVTDGATDDWQVVVSPSGNASAVCHWKK